MLAIIGTFAAAQATKTRVATVMEAISAFERQRPLWDMSVPRADGELLRRLVEENNVRNAVEIGTFRGYSGSRTT